MSHDHHHHHGSRPSGHRLTRRGFLTGCSAAVAAMAGSRFNTVAFGNPGGGTNDEIFIHVFLRGGMDGLNFLPPIAGDDRMHYENARPDLQVPDSGTGSALALDSLFGMHPSAGPLFDLYQAGFLALIHAVGMNVAGRSHFDAMQYIELGTPGEKSALDGWLTRHLQSSPCLPSEIVMPSISIGDLRATSLLGSNETLTFDDPGNFSLDTGPWRWRPAQRTALRQLYGAGATWMHDTGLQALDAVDLIELNASGGYTPANGATYPDSDFGDHLQAIAQMIKLDLGLRVATLDLGGWDTHNGQGDGSGGYFADLVSDLASGLAAFYTDLDGAGALNYAQRLTIVVQSEFGRRLRENADGGTDHGHGNVMMVLGGNVNGGLYGTFPGLATEQLFDNADLEVTTDYRRVLTEILIRRLENDQIGTIFPGYDGYSPLGVVQGTDLPPDLGNSIFSDGFESGDLAAWSNSQG